MTCCSFPCLHAQAVCLLVSKVLSFQFQVSGQEISLIQIMPDSHACAEGGTTLQALQVALQGVGNASDLEHLRPTQKHLKSYRVATKHLLHAMRNCIQLLLPDYNYSKSQPKQLLQPAGTRDRYELGSSGKKLLGVSESRKRFFLFNAETGESRIDFLPPESPSPLRVVFAADEGSDNFGAFLHLAHVGLLITWFPDLPHKIHRKQAGALKRSAEAASVIKLATKAFRSTRGPWSTSRFGRARQEARARMVRAMEEVGDNNLLQVSLAGMARDLGLNPTELSTERALRILKENKGLPRSLPVILLLRTMLNLQANFTGAAGTWSRKVVGLLGTRPLNDKTET